MKTLEPQVATVYYSCPCGGEICEPQSGTMMNLKTEIIDKHGKHDGKDHLRWLVACEKSQELDRHVEFIFESLINLENQGLISQPEICS